MIRRELKNRLINLEGRIAAAARAKRAEVQAKLDEVNAPVRHACTHALAVAALALYGEPKIEEPLYLAQIRMVEKLAKELGAVMEEWWIRICKEKPHLSTFGTDLVAATMYPRLMFGNLRGGTDKSKFEQIFSEAPAWLLKFTAVEWDAKLLGFGLRELVGAPELGRKARLDRNYWPYLPGGTIDAGGPCSEPDEPWEEIVKRRCHERPIPFTWRRQYSDEELDSI